MDIGDRESGHSIRPWGDRTNLPVRIAHRLRDLDPYIAAEIERTARLDGPLWEYVLATFIDLPHPERGQRPLPEDTLARLLDVLPPRCRGRGLLMYREAMLKALRVGPDADYSTLRAETERCGLAEWRLVWPDLPHTGD